MPPFVALLMLASAAQPPPARVVPRQPVFTPHGRPIGHRGVPGSGNRGGHGAPPNAGHHHAPKH